MKKTIIQLLILMVCILLISQIVSLLPSFDSFNQKWVDSYTRNNSMNGILNFILLSVLLVSLGFPRQLSAFIGGYTFGFAEGLLYSTLAVTVSCGTVFFISRYFARPLVTRYFNPKIIILDKFLNSEPFIKSIIVRLLPLGNNLLTNLIAGVSRIRPIPFISGSAIGFTPQMAVFALMGKGIMINSEIKIIISTLLFTLSGALSGYLVKKYRDQSTNNCQLECSRSHLSKHKSNEYIR
ncbi:VTT domain-containing protein [Alteromonas pelagimontana]|uniref:TVP38/TMEM64 family membrane protein n=1 Tax=Alteromonas pelagimontana TaxID=1858656 RepID=A0A6M4MFU2_9ALTE|nr:VTT domain-containing protein [Alteromonas pelagimontana]QJR81485.1 VTT domain-containing protein [Alteromonas pelagimontana]